MKCVVCGVEFNAVRTTAKYCTELCRQRGHRVSVTKDGVSVTENLPDDLSVTDEVGKSAGVVDLAKDLHLDLKKDLGVDSWSADGIFIRPDITIDQVQNIARLIHAKHGRPCPEFRECR
jgi:hypothetical protein